MLKRYLVRKAIEPTRAMRLGLPPDDRPIESEVLLSDAEARLIVEGVDLTEAEAAERRGRAHVYGVELDSTVKAPPPLVWKYDQGFAFTPAGILSAIGAAAAHGRGWAGRGQKIAVIDTGCSEDTRRELGSRLVHAESVVAGEPSAFNANDTHGDWVLQAIAHVAPEAEYVVIKCLSGETGTGATSGTIRAAQRARELGCGFVSASLGGPRSAASNDAFDAIARAGVMAFAAAGNEQRGKAESDLTADRVSPASAALVLTVAAADDARNIAAFSNRGTCVDLSAPGVDAKVPNVEGYWSGTSMATPVVAAAAALLRSAGLTPSEARQALLSAARDTSAPATAEGMGFLDVAGALPKDRPGPEPGEPETVSYSRLSVQPKPLDRPLRVTWRGKPFFDASPPAGAGAKGD